MFGRLRIGSHKQKTNAKGAGACAHKRKASGLRNLRGSETEVRLCLEKHAYLEYTDSISAARISFGGLLWKHWDAGKRRK